MRQAFFPKEVIVEERFLKRLPLYLMQKQFENVFVMYSERAVKPYFQDLEAIEHATFYEMPKGEPTLEIVADCLAHVPLTCDAIVAIGGGSTIDVAKVVAARYISSDVALQDIHERPYIERLPIVAIPTTAGTGSEATRITVITDAQKGVKLNPAHADLIPDVVILDSAFLSHIPAHIAAFTALDALTHAVEAYVSTKATPLSDMYALQAMTLISANITKDRSDMNVRQQLLLGSFYAGVAISNASTNLAHATGRALGTTYALPHGQSVALMHPFVIAFSLPTCRERYEQVAHALGLSSTLEIFPYFMQLNDTLHIWESAAPITKQLDEAAIHELVTKSLSGNGILTNRQIPTAEDITQIFNALVQQLTNQGGINVWQ